MAEKEKEKEVTEKVVSEAEELPKAIVRRVVKEKLSQLSTDSEISVLRDSLQAFSESARIFIHYLSATANDMCKESNRQIINAEDVFKALDEIEFPEFVEPLRAALEEFRQKNAEKKSASLNAKDTNKNAKRKESPAKGEGKDTNKKAKKKESSAKIEGDDTNKKAKKKESSAKSEGDDDTNKTAKKKESSAKSDGKDTNKKGKTHELPAKSEGRRKQREDNAD